MNLPQNPAVRIERWERSHPDFALLAALFDSAPDEGSQLYRDFEWEERVVFLVAVMEDANRPRPVGLLKLVVHPIGADMGRYGPVLLGEEVLREGKVMEFVVHSESRRRGIGRALQERAVEEARALGCYQLRSHSGGDRAENHQLKLSMGFAIDPVVRGEDTGGPYFLLPLRGAATEKAMRERPRPRRDRVTR